MRTRATPRATLAGTVLWLAFAVSAYGGGRDGQSVASVTAPRGSLPTAHSYVVRTLRDSRNADAPPAEQIVASLADHGPAAFAPMLEILIEARIPALLPTEREQILSVPQRELLLAALAQRSSRTCMETIEARLADKATLPERIAALYVYSAMGESRHLERVLALALAEKETELDSKVDDALRTAFTRILVRDPEGFRLLDATLDRARPELHASLVFAIGATRDPRGVEALAHLLAFHVELADVVVAQARLLGRSPDPAANRRLADEVRPHLAAKRLELCSAAARTLGELGDTESVPQMIELLESPSESLRESAYWALKRSTRLPFPAEPEAWRSWLEAEQAWWTGEAPSTFERLETGIRAERVRALQDLGARSLHRNEIAERVAEALAQDDQIVRRKACDTLRQLGSPAGSSALLGAFSDSDEGVRLAARQALAAIHGVVLPEDPDACRTLLRL